MEARCLLAAIAWDGGPIGTGTDWNTAANWVGDVLPGSADDAQIGAGFAGITYATDTRTIRSLSASSDVTIFGGSLTILDNSSFNAAVGVSGTGTLTLDSLTLSGTGSLTNAAILNVTGGTINTALDNQSLLVATSTNTIAGALTTDANSILRVQSQANGFSSVLNVTNKLHEQRPRGTADAGRLQRGPELHAERHGGRGDADQCGGRSHPVAGGRKRSASARCAGHEPRHDRRRSIAEHQ